MSATTPEQLGDDLDEDLTWRRTELQVLRSDIVDLGIGSLNSPRARALLRSGVALLYAHWEGFCKHAGQAYLDYVARRQLRAEELSDSFLLLALSRVAKSVESDPERAPQLLEFVRKSTEMRPTIPRRGVVITESNLRHKTLRRVSDALGLSFADFELKAQLIDRSLCDARNDIAHGRALFPTRDEFLALHTEVLGMMEVFRDLVLAAAATRAYRSSATP